MPILGKFTKQSSEILAYDIDFTDWASERPELSLGTPTATTDDPALVVVSCTRTGSLVTVTLSGGVNGAEYKVTVQQPAAPLLKEADFKVKIKDV